MPELKLSFGLAFEDLYDDAALARVDAAFLSHVDGVDAELKARLTAARAAAHGPDALDDKAEADLLLELAPFVDAFIGELFSIEDALRALSAEHVDLRVLYDCKRLFVQRRALKGKTPEDAAAIDGPALEAALAPHMGGALNQMHFATTVMTWVEDEDANADNIQNALDYALWATLTDAGRARHAADVLFGPSAKLAPGCVGASRRDPGGGRRRRAF